MIKIGDTVSHIKDPQSLGVVVSVDYNLIDITTCMVKWNDCADVDIQWSNKLVVNK